MLIGLGGWSDACECEYYYAPIRYLPTIIYLICTDVSNARTDGGFPMTELWYTVYIIMAVMIVLLIPFAIFYYEAEDPTENK